MILAQWGARGAAPASPKARPPQPSSPAAPVAANSPGRPQRLMAKPNVVGTGSRLSGITEGIVGHDPVAMASAAGGVVGL